MPQSMLFEPQSKASFNSKELLSALRQRKYEQLSRGGEVRVSFAGSAALLRGTIVFVQGPGATDQAQANGARLWSVAKDELVLKVAIEAADLQRAYGPAPQIGRRAQIFFD